MIKGRLKPGEPNKLRTGSVHALQTKHKLRGVGNCDSSSSDEDVAKEENDRDKMDMLKNRK